MAILSKPALRVAIIRNYKMSGVWGTEMLDSISNLVQASSPDALIEVFSPLDGGQLPDASKYGLVILTGGTFDLTRPELEPWVAETLEWIRNTIEEHHDTKLIGLCWGHQVISHALGGTIAARKDGTLASIRP